MIKSGTTDLTTLKNKVEVIEVCCLCDNFKDNYYQYVIFRNLLKAKHSFLLFLAALFAAIKSFCIASSCYMCSKQLDEIERNVLCYDLNCLQFTIFQSTLVVFAM